MQYKGKKPCLCDVILTAFPLHQASVCCMSQAMARLEDLRFLLRWHSVGQVGRGTTGDDPLLLVISFMLLFVPCVLLDPVYNGSPSSVL